MENVKKTIRFYNSRKEKKLQKREFRLHEEILHALTHGIGALAGALGLLLLFDKASGREGLTLFSVAVYGISLIVLYSASCAYHVSCAVYGSTAPSRVRDFFMKCDHSMIFFLILGTYTPACLISMRGEIGFSLFAVVASCCIAGIVMNVKSVERFYVLSQILYLVAGWTIVIALYPYYKAVGSEGIVYLVIGGVLYTVGVFFYRMQNVPNMHIIWHLFTLAGSVAHFFMVYICCL